MSESSKELLEQSFIYQNNTTGVVSPLPLTTRQLCRLLCPASGVVLQNVSEDTQVLHVINGNFEQDWKAAKTVPVLQEACAQWYFAREGTQQGPYSCRALADLLETKEITNETNLWSSHMGSTWRALKELPYLLAALEAFVATSSANADTNKEASAYDDSAMTFDAKANDEKPEEPPLKDVQDELDAFLSSTAHLGPKFDEEDELEAYESDGGTKYVKDPRTDKWVHEALAPASEKGPSQQKRERPTEATNGKPSSQEPATKKRKKPKFSSKNAKCWIYVQGLPSDTDEAEAAMFFSKVGIIELDPETQRPKIKLYRLTDGSDMLKGDASICYARPESVELALQLLDEAPYRPSVNEAQEPSPIRVMRAKFEQHGKVFEKKAPISMAKRKVAKLAALQAIGWEEDDSNGRITGGRKGLRIIVLKHMFRPSDLVKNEDEFLQKLEQEIRQECQQWGVVEKITVFSKHPEGVVILKFTQPTAASAAVAELDGRQRDGRTIEAIFWDGVTDYTVRDEEREKQETEKRQEEFGSWLDNQDDLPEELQLKVEGKT